MIFWKPVIRIKIISEQNRFCYNYSRLQVGRREKNFVDDDRPTAPWSLPM